MSKRTTPVETWDPERALDEVTKARVGSDPMARTCSDYGDRLAHALVESLPLEQRERGGFLLLHSASCLAAVVQEVQVADHADTNHALGVAVINILAFTGERLVRDARAVELAGGGT